MHLYGLTRVFLLPSIALYAADSVVAGASAIDLSDKVDDSFPPLLYDRDGDELGHGQNHGNAIPVVQLNETEVLLYHDPTPPSYWSIDIDDPDPGDERHPSLMLLHSLFMMFAFLGALPAGSSWARHIIASVLIPHDRDRSSFC